MWQIDESLRRLGTDYVDLYQIHRFDPATPLEEDARALDDLVRAGKVRYLGASSMDAWRFSKALHLQRANGWARFVTMQDHYNLVNREEEREMLPSARTRAWDPCRGARSPAVASRATGTRRPTGARRTSSGKTLYAAQEDSDRRVAAAVAEVAGARGVPRAQVALAWVSRNPVVTAPIVGGTKVAHIEDAVASLDLELTADEVSLLEEHYVPHAVVGY